MLQILNVAHYEPKELNDNFSENAFSLFLKRIDVNKKFLTADDVEELKKYKKTIDDELLNGKIDLFLKSNALLKQRMKDVEAFYPSLLDKPFDLNSNESLETDPDKLSYAKDLDALKEEWRKTLKYQTLLRVAEELETQEKNLTRKDTAFTAKPLADIEKEARERVKKNYQDFFKRLNKIEDTDRLAVYLNSISNAYDPHTEFFAPKTKQNFDIAMSGQLEGIGAQLQERDGSIKVSNIVPGSPSWRQGELKAGDIILKVAQGAGEAVDISDMPLDEAVMLIRGKKGTEVRLTVKKIDGSSRVIKIIRDVVILEETYAKSLLIGDKKARYGYIKLPSFYADFNQREGRRCADDIKAEVLKLKAEGVSGIIIDLRNNGGGSLQDVVEIAGLFIPGGPVVQVRGRGGMSDVLMDRDTAVIYSGPLAIMVNNVSASASEILAAAMQDYKRGIIVGGEQTFGKGTVQRIFGLDDYVPFKDYQMKPLGSIKLTTQKFYRVNGGATQLKGVQSDIRLPDRYEALFKGEREEDYPMPWDEIKPSAISLSSHGPENLSRIKENSRKRVESSEAFRMVRELATYYNKQAEETVVNLTLQKLRDRQKENKDEGARLDTLLERLPKLDVVTLRKDLDKIQSDSTRFALHKDWLKNVSRDIYVRETVEVLKEFKNP